VVEIVAVVSAVMLCSHHVGIHDAPINTLRENMTSSTKSKVHWNATREPIKRQTVP